jgi:hypothetical protein
MTLRLRRPITVAFGFLMMVVLVVGFAQPAQAACAQDNTKTTSSSQSSFGGRLAFWTTSDTYTGGAPCVDINVINQNRSTKVTGAYKTGGIWTAGSNGWLLGPQYELVPVVTDIQGSGIPFRTGSWVGSTIQQQLS